MSEWKEPKPGRIILQDDVRFITEDGGYRRVRKAVVNYEPVSHHPDRLVQNLLEEQITWPQQRFPPGDSRACLTTSARAPEDKTAVALTSSMQPTLTQFTVDSKTSVARHQSEGDNETSTFATSAAHDETTAGGTTTISRLAFVVPSGTGTASSRPTPEPGLQWAAFSMNKESLLWQPLVCVHRCAPELSYHTYPKDAMCDLFYLQLPADRSVLQASSAPCYKEFSELSRSAAVTRYGLLVDHSQSNDTYWQLKSEEGLFEFVARWANQDQGTTDWATSS
ncbi:hypothetical protein MTO96_012300 [Rhipicephalus appendiculatus]